MAWTQTQLDALEEAIATGAKRVKYADKEIEYGSIREMMQLREAMKRSLGLIEEGSTRFYPEVTKGMDSCDE